LSWTRVDCTMKRTDYFGKRRVSLRGRHTTPRVRATRHRLHKLPRPQLPAAQDKKASGSVPLKRIYADILPTSVRQQT
jgi:hypothetical protein